MQGFGFKRMGQPSAAANCSNSCTVRQFVVRLPTSTRLSSSNVAR